MIRVATWIDAETEVQCAFVALSGHQFVVAGSCLGLLEEVVKWEVRQHLPGCLDFELGFVDLGWLRRPVSYEALARRVASA